MPDTPAPSPDGVPRPLVVAGGWAWRLVAIALAIVALGIVLTRLAVVVLPLVIAVILATIAVPPARWLERRGLPSSAAAAIIVLGSRDRSWWSRLFNPSVSDAVRSRSDRPILILR